jgi:hypothetical protein
MEINKTPVDIKTLIQTSSIQIYDKTKLIDKLQHYFSEEEQKLYVVNLFLYLNYHPVDDFVVNLENVWKFIGFSNKANGKRLLKQHFTENRDYKLIFIRTDENKTLLIRTDEQKNKDNRGRKEETIMLNINTFKKLCLKSNTDNADKIHDYYIKLEMVYNELMKEQLEEQQKKIQLLENKPETEGFCYKNGYIYLIKDESSIGSYKIGLCDNPDKRLTTLNIGSSQKTLEFVGVFKCNNTKSAEKIIHVILDPFKIKKRNEWFYLSNNIELNYAVYIIKKSIEITDNYNFIDHESFKIYAEKLPLEIVEKEKKTKKYTNSNFLKRNDKLSQYNGVSWCIKNNKWASRLTKDNKTIFLGVYDTEIEAAIIYNDYASYLNNKVNTNYKLNEIINYVPNPRDILEENYKNKYENKTSSFNGVYFITSLGIFEASIQYKNKSYKLIKNESDLECAKVYNEQALYFNNHFETNYKLNEIPNFVTIEKNHIPLTKTSLDGKVHQLEKLKKKKYSRFTGVTIRNDNGKFRTYIKHNGKVIHCGTFKDELDAAKAYNLKAEELNKLESTQTKYELNNLEL